MAFVMPDRRYLMNLVSTAALSLAMVTDAFAVAIGKGAALQKPNLHVALRIGLILGVIEGVTPFLGWLLGQAAAPYVDRLREEDGHRATG